MDIISNIITDICFNLDLGVKYWARVQLVSLAMTFGERTVEGPGYYIEILMLLTAGFNHLNSSSL